MRAIHSLYRLCASVCLCFERKVAGKYRDLPESGVMSCREAPTCRLTLDPSHFLTNFSSAVTRNDYGLAFYLIFNLCYARKDKAELSRELHTRETRSPVEPHNEDVVTHPR
ncbi:hypothetical protein EJ03DRAFT_35001 [Teratosphaeria nubilosa]|uniref:Uncharacterized protein n=1 Tax=Teratosphaeria nubilosa TaxID=161662 RepID=A0A6G1KUD2_9PEZI|nr:hypothetical protein EJ03DRAFT_35001 [Teratosphaeria nubilosa]